MRLVINIFLIILIVFSLSIIPINYQLIDIPLPSQSDTTEEPSDIDATDLEILEIETTKNNSFLDTNEFIINITSNNKSALTKLIDSFDIEISDFNTTIKKSKLTAITNNATKIKSSKDKESDKEIFSIKYTFKLKNLDITSGYYTAKIKSSNNKINPNLSLDFLYLNNSKYIGSSKKAPENRLYTKLYYADENYLRLIPVNKEIAQTERFIRNTVNELLVLPDKKYGLSDTITSPKVRNIYISNSTARIDLDSYAIKEFDKGSTASQFALYSIIKTIGKFDIVNNVKFFVNDKDTGDYFHGTDISKPFKIENKTKAYVGLETSTNRIFLYPIELNEESLNNKISLIISTLKTSSYNSIATKGLVPTVPSNVKLLNYKFNERNIELNFSKDFLNVFKGNTEFNTLMYDSILYSYTSIEGIDTVSIVIEGEKVESFNNIDISSPQKPNPFINTLN